MSWARLVRVTAPAALALALPAAKAQVGAVEFDDDDARISDAIAAAIAHVDGPNGLGLAMINQTWRLSLDRWPPCIEIPLTPVSSVTSIKYRDPADVEQTLDPALYALDLDQQPVRIVPAVGVTWPTPRLRPGAIKIEFVAGYGATEADVPADLRQALKLLVSHFYANTDAVGQKLEVLPLGVEAVFDRYRISTFG